MTIAEPSAEASAPKEVRVRNLMEDAIRYGLLLVWAMWCFRVIHPFISFLVWGVVVAVALHPMHVWLARALGDRPKTSATLLTTGMLVTLVGPIIVFTSVAVAELRTLAGHFADGELHVPKPPAELMSLPFIGATLTDYWWYMVYNTDSMLAKLGPEIKSAGAWTLEAAAGIGLGIFEFVAAIIVAGVLLLHAKAGKRTTQRICSRLAGDRGLGLADLAEATVRSVTRGVLGVAVIQALLAGVGMVLIGVPFAGLWTLVCLLLALIQIGPVPVLLPAIVWVFSTHSALAASLFLGWSLFVMVIDNVLRPMLLGRGVTVPMPVILLGVMGGMLSAGIIGLFLGSVILALGYQLFRNWLQADDADEAADAAGPDAGTSAPASGATSGPA